MTDNEINAEDSIVEEEEVGYIFSSNPAVESVMVTTDEMASYYRLAYNVLTGKMDSNFTEWQDNGYPGVEMGTVENVPDLSKMVEWMHLDASLASLLEFKKAVSKLQTELHLAIFGKYAKKNVRGMVTHKIEDLQALRKALIIHLDGTVNICKTVPMLQEVTEEKLYSIPSVGKKKPFGDSFVWNFPDAPNVEKSETDKAAAVSGTNLRKHNTNVKFVVDGEFPEEDSNLQLGDLCAKYFDKSTQDVGKMFDGWAKEYFIGKDGTLPEKGVERNGKRFFLTYYSK